MAPTKFQSVDEHVIKFKGHNILRQYVKGKPIQWGFKLWCRCDSKTGYLFEFDLYSGKKCGQVEYGLGEGVVLKLTEKLKDLKCEVYIDNYFNSPLLQFELLQKDIFSAGTVRANRKHLPKAPQVKPDKAMERGEVQAFEAEGIRFVKWMDNKAVLMLSNFISVHPLKEVKRRKKGTSTSEMVSCPAVIEQYNNHMGGVDIMDQKKTTYQFDHRSKYKYYLRVVHDLIDIAINNAHVVFLKLQQDGTQNMDEKWYRRMIARPLIGNFTCRKRAPPNAPIITEKKSRFSKSRSNATPHTMEKCAKRQRCKLCTRRKQQNLTNNKCVECNIHLCYVNNRNCFQMYHDS